MSQTLIKCWKIGLATAKQYPNSKIIVSGGIPAQGITEADAMSKWLILKGINKDRIILENKSMDTIENALFTILILEKEGFKNITLVTSASHMRRALTIFNVASNFSNKMNGQNSYKNFSNLAYMDYSSPEKVNQVSQAGTLKVYRDLFRTSGIWIFPEIQR
ncbi:YdcF family protein [Bacillus sp. RC206]|uniref:YdcF family protein n=1 Tax=Bacillus sp. RC206 TaxID=3156281 RepID=UPI003837E652